MENFVDQIKALSRRIQKIKDNIQTEEATKTSVMLPFFQILGYDIFNPEEFVPEFTADVGIKKGEKVDYAILQDGKPVILIEAKSIQDILTKHDSQLFRYFGTTTAKFAILTNGIIYRFFTDLDEQNKMDATPFFEFNLFDIKDHQLIELSKFHKDKFNIENINTTAAELRYTNEIKKFLRTQWDIPSDEFVSYILSEVYSGKKTKQIIEKFNGIVKKSFKEFVNDMLNDKLQSALANTKEQDLTVAETAVSQVAVEPEQQEVVTTAEEIEGYITVKVLLQEIIAPDRIHYRDNLSYFNILIDNSIRKWVCRLYLNNNNKTITFNDENNTSVKISSVSDILTYKEKISEVAKRFL
ncbi:type I restriction endonuclease [Cohnella thailandensis]|uniref:Type I restriction enzyme HsdR N-terminal domain-containing protein n=1 Tax=Cohnella thailandensis TaxID=557557 RepID=A0A841T219_9BACL|nr:type I restriction endonuclease [Cohnella thailandensis]MBB6637612.1 type I restriction enzyme HsdR N-terminal domain-containing protein [Cohnella thailandensis]MBP1974212.1 hypothetical protein [Cohnella thailandensis]